MDGVVELEGVGVLDALADLAKLRVIGVKSGDDLRVAVHGALAGLDFCSVSVSQIGRLVGIHAGTELLGFCHQVG